ncbi:hypothetical protein GGR57DRAFT_511117 [Xylariaceae sp. FL1272]|nr:hypothetical protein GGR57DRAFT_511117 [Xylariaceae sp. FL1272]
MAADGPLPNVQLTGTFNDDGVPPCISNDACSNQEANLPASLLDRIASLDLPGQGMPHGARASSKPDIIEHADESMPLIPSDQSKYAQHHDKRPWDAKGEAPETRSDSPGLIGQPAAHSSHETENKPGRVRQSIDYNDPDCVYKPPETASSTDGFQDSICGPESSSQLTSSSSSLREGKQKATEIEPELGHSVCTQGASGADGVQTFRQLSVDDPGWERSAGRPPQKLPIRFKDGVGRQFIFPWEKAKQWKDMEKLIQQCFVYTDALGRHVQDGHYDLLIDLPNEAQIGRLTATPSAGSSIASASTSSANAVLDSAVSAASSSTASESSSAKR